MPTHGVYKPLTDSESSCLDKAPEKVAEPLHPVETNLRKNFRALVENLSVEEALRLQPDRKVPKNIGEYRFVPIIGANSWESSQYSAGSHLVIPEDVICNYRRDGGNPYLDCNFAIGLTYRGKLAALAGARVEDEGQLCVVQLQAVNSDANSLIRKTVNGFVEMVPAPPELKYTTGLYSGFYWRDTLVQAWMNIAPDLGVETFEIQGADNNKWKTDELLPQLKAGYDEVAVRMELEFVKYVNNWSIAIGKKQITEAERQDIAA